MKNSAWETPGTVGMLLDNAGQASTRDPEGSLPLIKDAARAAQDIGMSCLISRTFALWASVLAVLERLEESAEMFERAILCDCCRSWVERLRASLVLRSDGPAAAVQVARNAASLAKSRIDVALGHATLGNLLTYIDEFEEATRELSFALGMVPLKSSYWEAVQVNLSRSLAHSSDAATVREAVEYLRTAPEGWVGIKGSVLPRAKHAWTLGQALAKLAEVDGALPPGERQDLLSEAVDSLNLAIEKLEILGLNLEIIACRTDLALIVSRYAPLLAPAALDFEPAEMDPTVSEAWGRVRKATASSPKVLHRRLSDLREATIARGATSPLLRYSNEVWEQFGNL